MYRYCLAASLLGINLHRGDTKNESIATLFLAPSQRKRVREDEAEDVVEMCASSSTSAVINQEQALQPIMKKQKQIPDC